MQERVDYSPFPFAPTSVAALLAAPWLPALLLLLHGAYGVAPERTWWSLSLSEAAWLAAGAWLLLFATGVWSFGSLGRLGSGPAVGVAALALALAQGVWLVSASAQVPGSLAGVLVAWSGMLLAAFGVLNTMVWLPRRLAGALLLAMASFTGLVAGAWLGGVAAGLGYLLFVVLAYALLPLATLAEPFLAQLVPPGLALVGGLAGGFLAVRVGRALLIAVEDEHVATGLAVLVLAAALGAGAAALALLRSPEAVALTAEPAAWMAVGAFALAAVATLGFALLRQARLRARFGPAARASA